jgi:hypothetical protein
MGLIRLWFEGTDLIYEGITTRIVFDAFSNPSRKELTWFTKGLRLQW